MSDYNDQYIEKMARTSTLKRRLGMAVGVLAVTGVVLGVFVIDSASQSLPPAAEIEMTQFEGDGYSIGCPSEWESHSPGFCMGGGQLFCLTLVEELGWAASPSEYFAVAVANGVTSGAVIESESSHEVNSLDTYRVVMTEPGLGTQGVSYIYTQGEQAFYTSCSGPVGQFADVVSTFDAVGQSFSFEE